jgi:hypothetical protein
MVSEFPVKLEVRAADISVDKRIAWGPGEFPGRKEPAMRIVVWGNGIVESRMLWERGESSLEAHHLAETLSMAWDDIDGLERWAVEIECPDPDDVLRLVEETSGDDAVLGWSPAPKEIPTAWFMADEPFLPGADW